MAIGGKHERLGHLKAHGPAVASASQRVVGHPASLAAAGRSTRGSERMYV
jgi:hypothetical protein